MGEREGESVPKKSTKYIEKNGEQNTHLMEMGESEREKPNRV